MVSNTKDYMNSYMKEYNKKTHHCETCNKDIKQSALHAHRKSRYHVANEKAKSNNDIDMLKQEIQQLRALISK